MQHICCFGCLLVFPKETISKPGVWAIESTLSLLKLYRTHVKYTRARTYICFRKLLPRCPAAPTANNHKSVRFLRFRRRSPATTRSRIFRGSPAGRSRVVRKANQHPKCTIIKISPPRTPTNKKKRLPQWQPLFNTYQIMIRNLCVA